MTFMEKVNFWRVLERGAWNAGCSSASTSAWSYERKIRDANNSTTSITGCIYSIIISSGCSRPDALRIHDAVSHIPTDSNRPPSSFDPIRTERLRLSEARPSFQGFQTPGVEPKCWFTWFWGLRSISTPGEKKKIDASNKNIIQIYPETSPWFPIV